jgi:hypothetical protein
MLRPIKLQYLAVVLVRIVDLDADQPGTKQHLFHLDRAQA